MLSDADVDQHRLGIKGLISKHRAGDTDFTQVGFHGKITEHARAIRGGSVARRRRVHLLLQRVARENQLRCVSLDRDELRVCHHIEFGFNVGQQRVRVNLV